jgi:DNA repair exonuclease SbcCD nuclease subunit
MKSYPEKKSMALPAVPGVGTVRIVHTADTHLRLSCNGSTVRGRDFFTAAMSVVDIAKARNADAIINAGDILNSPDNLPRVVEQLAQLDDALKRNCMPMYTVQGNHDYAEPSWIDVLQARSTDSRHGLQLMPPGEVITVTGLRIAGLPFMSNEQLREQLKSPALQQRKPQVLVWHGAVLEFVKFPAPDVMTVADFGQDFSAVLLGDIHVCQYLQNGRTLIGYPGATELCKSDEPLEHSCTIIDFDLKGEVKGIELVPVDHRKVLPLRIDLEQQMPEALAKVRAFAGLHKRTMLLIKYCDRIEDVRSRFESAASGNDCIIRADSYSLDSAPIAQDLDKRSFRTPADYLPGALPAHRTDLLTLCTQLINPEAKATELLKAYCDQ